MSKRGEQMQAQVLAVLRASSSAMSAYDVMYSLRSRFPKVAPPTIYNALSALSESGHVHRVESLKAYFARRSIESRQASLLSICDDCGTIEERIAPEIVNGISGLLVETGFAPQRHVIEVHGVCSDCNAQPKKQ